MLKCSFLPINFAQKCMNKKGKRALRVGFIAFPCFHPAEEKWKKARRWASSAYLGDASTQTPVLYRSEISSLTPTTSSNRPPTFRHVSHSICFVKPPNLKMTVHSNMSHWVGTKLGCWSSFRREISNPKSNAESSTHR